MRVSESAHSLRQVFNGLCYIVKTGASWRWMLNDLPPGAEIYQQTQRWLAAGCFEALIDDLRTAGRQSQGRAERAIIQTAHRVDTLGRLLVALHVRPASARGRDEVENLTRMIQAVTGDSVEIAWGDQG
jgi:transposase